MAQKFLYFIWMLFFTTKVLAVSGDLIEASTNVNGLFLIAAQLMVLSLFTLGVGFIIISVAKYHKRKKMPTFIPLQTVVMMFFAGLFLIMVGILYFYTGEQALGPDYLSLFQSSDDRL